MSKERKIDWMELEARRNGVGGWGDGDVLSVMGRVYYDSDLREMFTQGRDGVPFVETRQYKAAFGMGAAPYYLDQWLAHSLGRECAAGRMADLSTPDNPLIKAATAAINVVYTDEYRSVLDDEPWPSCLAKTQRILEGSAA